MCACAPEFRGHQNPCSPQASAPPLLPQAAKCATDLTAANEAKDAAVAAQAAAEAAEQKCQGDLKTSQDAVSFTE